MPCQSSIYLHGVTATHWECLVNRLFISMVQKEHLECIVNRLFISMVPMILIGGVLSIVDLSPLCQGYSLGVSCQSSYYRHDVNGTHWECIVNRLFISMVSMVFIESVLSIVYYLHGVMAIHWEGPVNRFIISMVPMILI